ncbi:MAG: small-conductance mechanosensitive channel, partial [Merismopedia sp. SIO2A8]|nr:small-conductance mechanosensitive channel [Merismopedia sp. SIO2A8]
VGDVDPTAAITINDLTIPLDQLSLMVKPLTVEELQVEAAAWLILLRDKVQEISTTEIAIKRENQAIQDEANAAQAVKDAEVKLLEAEDTLAQEFPGTPAYEKAAEQLEEAKQALQQAEQDILNVAETVEALQEDTSLQDVLAAAENAEDIGTARQVLENARQEQSDLVAGTATYDALTKRIDTLAQALLKFEAEEEKLDEVVPESEEYQQLLAKVNTARELVVQAAMAIAPSEFGPIDIGNDTSVKSSATDVVLGEIASEINAVESNATAEDAGASRESDKAQLDAAVEQLDNVVAAQTELKNQLLVNVTDLQGEQAAIVERFTVILDALEQKGGDVASYRTRSLCRRPCAGAGAEWQS